MKERRIILLTLLVTMMLPMKMFAQSDDFGMWFSAGAEKKVSSRWSVGVEGEFRTRDNMKTADRWSIGIDGGYKVTDWLKASAGYTLLFDHNVKETYSYYDDEDDEDEPWEGKVRRHRVANYWGARHRFNVSLTGSVTFGRLKLSLRERWQYTYRPEKTVSRDEYRYVYDIEGNLSNGYPTMTSEDKTYDGKGKNVLRSRLMADYNIPHCKVDPFASVEAYNAWSLQKIRYTVGADWKIGKPHTLTFYYRYQNVRDDDDEEPNMHIIGLGYKYKF